MKRLVAVLCLVVALAATNNAHAASRLDEMAEALKASPVYVAPGTEKTDSETAGMLRGYLRDNDHILVVMLPDSATNEAGPDLTSFAQKIDQALGGRNIIGLSVGEEIVAYSALLPAGEAADLMQRAISVSTTPTETLVTFIRNVHDWQRRNPEAEASQSKDGSGGFPILPVGIGGGTAVVLGALGFILVRRQRLSNPDVHLVLRASPDPIRDVLGDIHRLRSEVHDAHTRDVLLQICHDTEAYFHRARRAGSNLAEDTHVFQEHLGSVRDVLDHYIDIQNNQRFYDNPRELMSSGYDAFHGFGDLVLNSIKRGNRKELTRFSVNTDILSAQRFR